MYVARSEIGGQIKFRPQDVPRAQSLHKYHARTNAGTPDPFRVTCPICLWFTKAYRFQISDFRCQISDLRFQISDFRCQISDLRFQISDFRFQISDVRFQVSDFKFQVSDFRFQVSYFRFPEANGKGDRKTVRCPSIDPQTLDPQDPQRSLNSVV